MTDEPNLRVGIIGLGNMGTAVAHIVSGNGHPVLGWEYDAAVVEEVNAQHVNSRYLPGIPLAPSLVATQDLREALATSQVVYVALPSAFIQRTLRPAREALAGEAIVVNMAKGIDPATGRTSYQMVSRLFPHNPCVMLSGPSIANEFARGLPTVVSLAGRNRTDLFQVARTLDNAHFRTRFSDDTMGVELGGLLKNIYAIGLGMFDGADIRSVNFRSVYLTIALEEMTTIGVAMGARAETMRFISGLGDLLATSLSEHSHNRRLGELLSQGLDLESIRAEMGVLPEGYNTVTVILTMAEKLQVSLPLAAGLWDVINGRMDPHQFIYAFIRNFVDY